MCYSGCKNENWHGECKSVSTCKCPQDMDEDEYVPDEYDEAEYRRDQKEDR